MNPFKYAEMMKYLTRAKKANPNLPDVFPASKAPIPAKTQNVEDMEAVNQFMLRNPRKDMANGGSLKFYPKASGGETKQQIAPGVDLKTRDINYGGTLGYEGDKFYGGVEYNTGKVKFDITDEGGTTLFKDTLSKDDAVNFIVGLGDRKGDKFQIKTDKDFNNMQVVFRKSFADGGMLVQPGFDGVRQGYRGESSIDPKLLNSEAVRMTDGRFKTWDSITDKKLRENVRRSAKRREQGASIGKGRPGVKKDYKTISPMKDPKVVEEVIKTRKKIYQSSPEGIRLQWIADNSKDYDTPDKLKKAYEKHFKHKVGSKADALFNIEKKPGTRGGVGSATGKKINFGLVDGLQNFNTTERGNLMFIKKGFSEDELFKGAILQNNPKVQAQFKNLFKDIHNNVSLYSELGPEGIVERLRSQGGNLLEDFDFIKSYSSGGQQTYGGVHRGITRNSLLNLGIPEKHIVSYQTVRKPLQTLEQILIDLKNRGASERYGISNSTAFKIASQLDNFLQGQGNIRKDIATIDKQLGDVKFKQIFGGVNFEHTLAKRFGKDYKYLPRNYLLKGQFTSAAFNQIKKNAFDLPLIDLMKKYEQGKVGAEVVQNFINDFNAKTNGYADFNFDADKGRLVYSDDAVKYDLSRYQNPAVARDELIKNIDLTMSSEFQKGFKNLPESRDQLKLFKSKEAKNIRSLLATLGGGKCGTRGFLNQGGRIGLQDGTVSVDQCYKNALERIRKGGVDFTKAESLNFNKITRSLKAIGASKIMKVGILPEVLLEGALIADKMASEGDTFAQGLRNSYLAIPFQAMGVAKTYEEGEKDRILAAAPESQKAKVLDVFNLQDTLNKKFKLMGASDSFKRSIAATDAISDGPLGYVGDSQDLQERLSDTRADLQDLYRGSDIRRAERIFNTKPIDLNIRDQLTMDAYNQAIEKADADKASRILVAPGTGLGVDAQIKKRMKEIPINIETAKQDLKATGDYYGTGYTPFGLNKLFVGMGMKDPRFGFNKTGEYNEEQGLTDFMNYMKTQNVADAGGVANLAGGGIAKMAGVSSGVAPESGPNPQGLLSLKNRVRNY